MSSFLHLIVDIGAHSQVKLVAEGMQIDGKSSVYNWTDYKKTLYIKWIKITSVREKINALKSNWTSKNIKSYTPKGR